MAEPDPKVWKGPRPYMTPRSMIFPYTIWAKAVQYPHAFFWKHGTFFRFYVGSVLLLTPTVFYGIHAAVNSEGNVEMWRKIRAARIHDKWAPLKDNLADDPLYDAPAKKS